MRRGAGLALAALLATAPGAPAQERDEPVRSEPGGAAVSTGAWRPLRVAKWTTLAAAVAAAAYGFTTSLDADDAGTALDRFCAGAPARCLERGPGEAYADAEAESLRRTAGSLDRRARVSLVAAQLGVAAALTLFLLDLRNVRPPPNVPFEPSALRVGLRPDGAWAIAIRFPAPPQ